MKSPPVWNEEELARDVEEARQAFRRERLSEPLEKWKRVFDEYKAKYERLFADCGVTPPSDLAAEQLAEIFQDGAGEILRYLAGPPISADDLKVLAETSLAPARILSDPAAAQRVLDVILKTVDPRRFPWIAEGRRPTQEELSAAVLASAALLTAQRVSTARRNEGKDSQERTVKRFLESMGFRQVSARPIRTLTDAPEMGEFCGESLVGSRKADISLRLHDGRLMPIECKVSNSATNSVKRINNDAQVKAAIWRREFGTNQAVPAAVLSGVFNVRNLMQAQEGGLTLFWAHDLEPLRAFVEATRSS